MNEMGATMDSQLSIEREEAARGSETVSESPVTPQEQENNDCENRCFQCCRKKNRSREGRDLGVWECSLEDQANVLSSWFLSYLDPFLKLGAKKVLEADDMGVPSKVDEASRTYRLIKKAWEEQLDKCRAVNEERDAAFQTRLANCTSEVSRQKVKPVKHVQPSIARALVNGFGVWRLVLALAYYILSSFLDFIPILILNDLVKYFESGLSASDYDGYAHPWVEVAALGIVPIIVSLLQTRHQVILAHCAVYARTAVSTLIYKKSLCVSAPGRAKTSTGQVVNLMSNDGTQLQRFLQFAGMFFVAPIQIVLCVVLIYVQVKEATWVGVGFILFLAPINSVVYSVASKMRREILKYSDARVAMMNEILTGIRIIKFYAWERPFGKEVGKLRDKELRALTKLAYVQAVGSSLILLSAPILQPIMVFLTYVKIQDDPLDAATAFTTVALFNMMRSPFAFLPFGLMHLVQTRISLRRLERYLQLPDLTKYVLSTPPKGSNDGDESTKEGSVTIHCGTFSWFDPNGRIIHPVWDESKRKSKKEDHHHEHGPPPAVHSSTNGINEENQAPIIALEDVSLSIASGALVGICGSVGSGKSSLLSAILGEMEPMDDSTVHVPRSEANKNEPDFITYSAQTPWVVNDTLRGNILFGRPFAQDRYDSIVEACALTDDIAVLPAGDMTEIGERGINLSGGQKSRVSLARALYSTSTKILLLDDPLSAVDAHVGETLFDKAIAGSLGKGRTRLLVTHHVHFLPRCDKVIMMDRGRITHQGTYDELIAQGVDFAGAVDVKKVKSESGEKSSKGAGNADGNKISKKAPPDNIDEKANVEAKGKKLVKEEEREEGSVSGSAYIHYARAGGWFPALGAVFAQGCGRGAEILSAFWLAKWAKDAFNASKKGHPHTDGDSSFYIGIYALIGMIGIGGLTVRTLIMAWHRLRASRRLHLDLTRSILRAQVAFFDVTPTGRILNRFAQDMDKVDLQLTQLANQVVNTIFSLLGAVVAIIIATKATFLVPLAPIGYIYYGIQKWFRKSSTEIQRVNSIANSPIFANFSQTLSGTSTIRAYGHQYRFFAQCISSFDKMNASYLLLQLVNFWLGFRLSVLGGFIGAFVGGVAVATASKGFIPAGWLGLALTYGIEVTLYLKYGVRTIALLEAEMNAVERILFYTNNVESEPPEVVPEKDPESTSWPSKGEIEIEHASLRYRDGPLVLKNICLDVRGGEKIGIVGRTASGKTSLMILLFRITEIEKDGGKVLIDGVDISEIGTKVLRINLSIIPQDPVLFSNTVSYNLDPFGTASDEELWAVLRKVQLADAIAAFPLGLQERVAEGGENFSQGQRQLLCIARSLLRNPKILVLDEATASIDNTTDSAIQKMIRENFADATILTIAHRLNTIMDNDRILVLENGRIVEFDTPQALLDSDGYFKAMVEASILSNSGQ